MFISTVDGLYICCCRKGWHSDECPLSCLPSPRWDNWASWRPPRHQPSYPHLPQTQWTSCQPGNQDLATQRLSFWRIKTIAPHILYESVYIFIFILIPHLLTLHIWASFSARLSDVRRYYTWKYTGSNCLTPPLSPLCAFQDAAHSPRPSHLALLLPRCL